MSDTLDLEFLELVSSKLCHDLISPIGAVNNGLEVLEELGADGGPEVIELISYSSTQAAARLKAFRMMYGTGGRDSNMTLRDAHEAIEDMLKSDNKIKQNWDPATLDSSAFQDEFGSLDIGFCKIIANVLHLASESLPKGGEISVETDGTLRIIAKGSGARLRDECIRALENRVPTSTIEPQAVHAALCYLFAEAFDYRLAYSAQEDGCIHIDITKN